MHKTLNDLCTLIVDCKNRTPPPAKYGETPVGHSIGTPDIDNGRILLDDKKLVNQETYDIWTARAVPQADDIVLTREAPVGRVGLVEPRMKICLGQRTMLLRPDPKRVNPRYLQYLLLGPQVQSTLHSRASGSTVPHLRVDQVRELPLPTIPDLPEQAAAAEMLSAFDNKIDLNQRIAKTARSLGEAKFQEYLVVSEHHRSKLVDITTALTRGGAPKYVQPEYGMIVVNQKCVRDGRVSLDKARHTLPAKVREERRLRVGDVLVNSTGVGTLGRVGLWAHDIEATVDSHITIVRFNPDLVHPIIGAYAVLSAQSRIESLGEGTTGQTELNRLKLGQLEVNLPTLERASQLADSLTALEEASFARLIENRTLAALRDTLLPQLITGKLRIKDAERAVEEAV